MEQEVARRKPRSNIQVGREVLGVELRQPHLKPSRPSLSPKGPECVLCCRLLPSLRAPFLAIASKDGQITTRYICIDASTGSILSSLEKVVKLAKPKEDMKGDRKPGMLTS